MHLSEIITSLNGLRYELEKQNDYDPQHFRSYYCEVIAEALTVLVDIDRQQGPTTQTFINSLAMSLLGGNMETTIDTTAAVARFATFTVAYTLTLGMVV